MGLLTSRYQVHDGWVRYVYWATDAGSEALVDGRRVLRELAREVLGEGR